MLNARWTNVTILYLTAFVLGLTFVLIPASSFILKSSQVRAVSDIQYGFLFFPMMVTAILTTLWFKVSLKRWGSEYLYSIAYMCLALSLTFVWLVTVTQGRYHLGFVLLLISNFFLGIGFALLVSVLNLTIVIDHPTNRDSIMTALHMSLGIGAAVCPLIIQFFYQQKMWAVSILLYLVLLGILYGVSMPLGVANAYEPEAEDRPFEHGVFPRGAWLFLLIIFMYGFIEGLLGIWSTVYLSQDKVFAVNTVIFALALFWFLITMGRFLGSLISLKIDARFLLQLSPLVMAISLLGIVMVQKDVSVLLFYGLMGLGCSCFFPFSVSLSTRYFPAFREQLCSLSIAVLLMGSLVGSVVVGFAQHLGWIKLANAFQIAAAFAFILVALVFKMTRIAPSVENK